jgi:iron complex transport system substrate-binding protein
MQKNKMFAIFAIVIFLVAALGIAYILNTNKGDEDQSETTVTDALGRTVNIPEQLNSIYCVGASSLRLVSYFDAVEKVQAIETEGTFNTRVDQTYYLLNKANFSLLPQIAATAEAILNLNPSVIVTSAAEDVAAADNLQAQTNIPVYVINANLEFGKSFYNQITSIGILFGEQGRATELNNGIAKMISEITSKANAINTNSAYACGMFYYGGASFLKGSGNYLPFDYSKVTNAIEPVANSQPYIITLETLINANPNYIFIDSIGLSDCIASINGFLNSNTGLDKVIAVKDSNIYSTMIYKCYGTNWENQLINVYYVASILNVDLYSWNFEDKANEIIELFYPETALTYSDIAEVQTGNGCNKVTL